MRINIKYIHNRQAVEVKGGSNWRIAFRNQQLFDHLNHVLNGGEVRQWSEEQIQGSRGDY